MESHSVLVKSIISICELVPKKLDTTLHYSEFCYQQLIRQLLEREGIFCETEAPVHFKTNCGITFGWGKIDILVRGEHEIVIIELKANVKGLYRAEKQVQRYMKHFDSNLPTVGLVFMFNSSDRQSMIKRIIK